MKNLLIVVWHFFTQNDFLVSLISSLFAAGLLAGWAYFFTNLFNQPKPNLVMVAKQKGAYSSVIRFIKQSDGSCTADFQLAIRNEGGLTLKEKEGFWHTYVITNDAVTPLTAPGELNHQRGVISYAIYPHYIVDIDGPQYHIVIKKGDTPDKGLPYFFATDYGFFPQTTRFNQETGQVDKTKIGLIKYELP